MRKTFLMCVTAGLMLAACRDGGPEPELSRAGRGALESGRLGEPVTQEQGEALLEAGWLKAVVTEAGAGRVDVAVAREETLTGHALISRSVPEGTVFFVDPASGRVVYEEDGAPGLVHQLVHAGSHFDIIESHTGDTPSPEELGQVRPEPQGIEVHPLVPGGLDAAQVQELLAQGFRKLPPGSHTQGVMLFQDPELPTPEGLYLGFARPDQETPVLGRLSADDNQCTCYTPGCGNPYKCPCYAVTAELGAPVSGDLAGFLLDTGWLKGVITSVGSEPVDTVAASAEALTGLELVDHAPAEGEELFIHPGDGRVVFAQTNTPGLVHQLVDAGYGLEILESRTGEVPSQDELGQLRPEPRDVRLHPVIPGGLSEEQVEELLAQGWKQLPPGSHTQGPMLFRDPESAAAGGLYLGFATAERNIAILGLRATGGDCTCVSPECGNKYACPCVAAW